MKKTTPLLFLAACILSACSSSPKKEVKKAPVEAYKAFGSGSFALRPLKEVTLDNGLKIIFIHDDTLPRISLTMLFKSGVLQDPRGLEGLNAITTYLLEQGTQTRSALQLADDFGQFGSEANLTPGSDFSLAFADSLSSSGEELLKVFADMVMNPAFADKEIVRMKSQILAGLQKKVDNPSSYADERSESFLFGAHAYHYDTNGTPAAVRKIRKQDIIRHYLMYFRPNNSSLAVVGSFGDDFEEQTKAIFSKWTKRNIPHLEQEKIPAVDALKIHLVTKKNLQQAQLRLAQVGMKRNDPDFLKLRVANEILGGSFASRLNQKVRAELGLTYSINSSFDSRADGGMFEISTFTKNETVEKTLNETLKVMKDFVDNGVNEKELQAAKNLLIGQFPRAIETSDKTAFNILALDFYGIPKSYLTDYNRNIEKITLKDVNDVIKRRLSAQNFKVLIYADPKVANQLKDLHVQRENMN